MRTFLILGLAVLVLGCQPSVEEQAKRELAIEAEKKKQLQDEKDPIASKWFIKSLRQSFEEDRGPGAAEKLKKFDICVADKKRESEVAGCFLEVGIQ